MTKDIFQIPADWNGLIILSVETPSEVLFFNSKLDSINSIRFEDGVIAKGRFMFVEGEPYKIKSIIIHSTERV